MRILVGYDGSAASRRALDWAARLAKESPDGSVRVIGVAETLEAAPPIPDAVDPHASVEVRRRDLAEAEAVLAAAGVPAETTLKIGHPAEEIIAAGDEGDVDLIVLGSTGAGRAVRFLLGSVSDRVVRHASRPVMVAR